MPFKIIRNDITKIKADIIVNSANPKPIVGGGTDSAVYNAAGREELLAARRKIGDMSPGEADFTDAFALDAKYIIHTVGPVWEGGGKGELEVLKKCYRNSLELAGKLECKSIAFPLISTGTYGFPRDEALQIALSEINRFLLSSEMLVILVVFDKKSFELSSRLVSEIEEYIDEQKVVEYGRREYGARSRNLLAEDHRLADLLKANKSGKLADFLAGAGQSFQEKLFELIDKSGMSDVEVYKKANIDRKVFSSIKCKKNYKPSKKTAISLAIALELDMPAMKDLLSRAEIALSPSSRFDLIISYFVEHGIYDIFEINAALFDYDQPILA